MPKYRFTDYFEKQVLRKRPYLRKEWCTRALENRLHSEPRERNRFRGEIPELEGRSLRVVSPEDRVPIHDAFPDRRFKP